MYAKLFVFVAAFLYANALNNNLKLEAFDTLDDNLLKAGDAIAFNPKAVSTVTYFTAAAGQQLVGQALNQVLPVGTQRLRLTYTSGAVGPTRISQVMAYVDLPPTNKVASALVYSKQFDRNFNGEIIFNYQLNQIAYLSWYVFAI